MTPVEELHTAARLMRRYGTKFWSLLADVLDAAAHDPAHRAGALAVARAYLSGGGS